MKTITINDKVKATLNGSEVSFDATVTGTDDVMGLVFLIITENGEEVAVDENQITENFGSDSE